MNHCIVVIAKGLTLNVIARSASGEGNHFHCTQSGVVLQYTKEVHDEYSTIEYHHARGCV
jgi:hypothetical protein